MALDPAAVGLSSNPVEFRWDADLAQLYALGVGAGVDDLAYTTDNSEGIPQKVLPTLPVLAVAGAFDPDGVLSKIGDFDWGMLVHGDQEVVVHRPIPTGGSVATTHTVKGIHDKGSGAAIVLESVSTSQDAEPLFTTTMTIFVRGAGGFGGDRGPSSKAPDVSGPADLTVTQQTLETQALLYRLTGDKNPLHSDPVFARKVGFDRPILHGLCTYGFVGRALLDAVCDGDDDRFGSFYGRFSSPVLPGDALTTAIWRTDTGAVFETRAQDERIVLDRGVFRFR